MADTQQKKGRPPCIGNWRKLDSAGDCKRFLRKVLLQAFADEMPMKKANGLANIVAVMLRAIEVADLETELDALQERLDKADARKDQTAPH